MPPRPAQTPRVRIGRRWISVWWILPIGYVLLILTIAAAQQLRELPAVQQFILRYPGDGSTIPVYSGFPLWLRVQHVLNIFFMLFIIRGGLQILADHPRLFAARDSIPGRAWFRLTGDVPTDRFWTSKDDAVTIPGWLGIPGVRHTVGLARWWHFTFDTLWLLNGIIFYVLLFTSDQWTRLVPTSWTVFPNALSTLIQYASLNFPVDRGWTSYNALQQLTYFVTVFIAAPTAALTGFLQGPAFANRLGWFAKLLNRQVARTIHFCVLCWFLGFILVHTTLAFITGARENFNHIFAGVDNSSWTGVFIYIPLLILAVAAWFAATPLTLKYARRVQRIGETLIGQLQVWAETWAPTNQYTEKDISPYFWTNGTLPTSDEYEALLRNNFADYKLTISGLVAEPRVLTLAELKAMPKQEQITRHFCIQGWSGVAKWGGVPMRHILELVKPLPEARYAVFYSFAEGAEGGLYYDVHPLHTMRHRLTLLAYEMNGAPLTMPHGAPLRLRVENELGFKMVKWIQAIELVDDFSHLGSGQGGYNEDHEFYGNRMPI